MNELNVLTVDTLEVEDISRVLAISKDETVVAMDPSGIKPDLSEYAKKDEIPTKVSELQNDSNFVTKSEIEAKIPTKVSELANDADYATKAYVDAKEPDLSDYAKKEDVPTKVSELVNDSDYATKEYVDTNEPDLSPYATIVYVDTIVGNINRILETI